MSVWTWVSVGRGEKVGRAGLQEDLLLASRGPEAVGGQGAERQRKGLAHTSWIRTDSGNSSGAGCGGPYEGVGCVHGVVVFMDSKDVGSLE